MTATLTLGGPRPVLRFTDLPADGAWAEVREVLHEYQRATAHAVGSAHQFGEAVHPELRFSHGAARRLRQDRDLWSSHLVYTDPAAWSGQLPESLLGCLVQVEVPG